MDNRLIGPSTSSNRAYATKEGNNSVLDNNRPKEVLSTTEIMHKKSSELSVSDAAFQKALERVNKALQGIETKFEYSVHEKTGDVIVKVINQETSEVLREIPPEKFIDLVVKLQELSGILIDEKR